MINSVVAAWWAWMAPMFWQVALLVTIIAVIDLLIRRWAWPQVRHALWLLVLVKLFIPPWWSHPVGIVPAVFGPVVSSVERLQLDRASSVEGPGAEAAIGADTRRQELSTESVSLTTTAFDDGATGGAGWRLGVFLVWLSGVVVFAVVLTGRMRRLARWHRDQERRPTVPRWYYDVLIATAEKLDLDRVPAIVFSEEAVTPAVYGVWRPVMVLPAHYTDELSPEEAEHVVLHELAHLKRGDLIVHSVVVLVQVIYWFNPFVAFARRQIKHVREVCCDLTVANLLEEKTQAYRQTLLDTARALLSESLQPSLGLLGVFEEPYKLVARVRWLEKPTWRRHRLMIITAWLVVLLAAPLVLPMASGVSEAQQSPPAVAPTGGEPGVDASMHGVGRQPGSGAYHHIRSVFRIDSYLLGIRVDSERVATSDTWVGPSMISNTERGRTTIVDLERRRITVVDHRAGTWAETDLPLDPPSLLSEEALADRRRIRTTGTVHPTGDSRKILGRRCDAYEVESWRTSGGGDISDLERYTVWATTDMPFDIGLFDALLLNLRLIYNREPEFRKELEKIRGLQMGMEGRDGNFLVGRRLIDQAEEINQAEPPPGTFEPPPDYRRLERLESIGL